MHQSCAVAPSGFTTLARQLLTELFFLGSAGVERGRPRGSLPSALRPVVLIFPLGFLRCVPHGVSPSFRLGFLLLALGLAAALSWPSACPSFPGFVFEALVYGIFAVFDVVSYFGRFRGIFRVAGCPLGGEICST